MGAEELMGPRGRRSTSNYSCLSPHLCRLALRSPSLHGLLFSRRTCERRSPTQTMLEGFGFVRSHQWFSGYFFPDPLEALPKFPQDGKPPGGDDCSVQRIQAKQQGFSRLVCLSGKFASITLLVIQAPAGKFSLLLTMHGRAEQFAGPVQWSSPSQCCFTRTTVWFPELIA